MFVSCLLLDEMTKFQIVHQDLEEELLRYNNGKTAIGLRNYIIAEDKKQVLEVRPSIIKRRSPRDLKIIDR